jgi:hypothetical protein
MTTQTDRPIKTDLDCDSYRRLSTVDGRRMMAFSRLKTPSTAIPISRNGSSKSQTIGYNTKASNASGQHRKRRISQSSNFVTSLQAYVFMFFKLRRFLF